LAVLQYRRRYILVTAVVLVSLFVRLHDVGFGLPSLYDPDEPIFMVIAAKLLANRTLNPGWFGHPGSTTIYLVALTDVVTYALGIVTGRFSNVTQFIHAAYANPAMLFLPARIVMALLGTLCVGLTYLIGRRLQGTATGLIAALLLGLNALHIAWSQVVRTDVHASVFMLAALLFAMRFARSGRTWDLVVASLLTGFAIATKWPSITVEAAVLGACFYRLSQGELGVRRAVSLMALSGLLMLAGVFLASPFILLDYPTVLANLSGEARHFHLGHTGDGFGSNLVTYMRSYVAPSMGWVGLAFAAVGAVIIALRRGIARFTLLPVAIGFLALICAQKLIWSRWLVPEMPFLCLFAAMTAGSLADAVARKRGRAVGAAVFAACSALLLVPTAAGALQLMRERANDTRAQAARWIVAHVPGGKTIALEHLELSLRDRPYRFLFPMGSAGCLDGERLLRTGVGYEQLDSLRNGSPIIDLGTVSQEKVTTCRADYVVLTYYDLYLREAQRFPKQLATYKAILKGGRTVALFRPRPGHVGGPIVRIVAVPTGGAESAGIATQG
jgi:hypothetical protein